MKSPFLKVINLFFNFVLMLLLKSTTFYWAIILMPYNSSIERIQFHFSIIVIDICNHYHCQFYYNFITSKRNFVVITTWFSPMAILVPLQFHVSFRIRLSASTKNVVRILIGINMGSIGYVISVKSANP